MVFNPIYTADTTTGSKCSNFELMRYSNLGICPKNLTFCVESTGKFVLILTYRKGKNVSRRKNVLKELIISRKVR